MGLGLRCTCEKAVRTVVVVVNGLFLIFGIVILIIGLSGYARSRQLQASADVLRNFNLPVILTIVFSCGICTIVAAVLGAIGAFKKWANVLKLYAFVVFCLVCIQIGLGAYLNGLRISDLQDTWEDDTADGLTRRISYQSFMGCCGFNYWTDSLGALNTPCKQLPTSPDYIEPENCAVASQAFIDSYIKPVAQAAIVIAVFELVTLLTSCVLLFRGKNKDDWLDAFHY